ncbi:hypothetical protein PsYK624_152490 [Phanerochaete sordida]|uniref:Uncharacterized protein n=1 Tax=Phanerochaete sordida TaxID=48140 RepID=A0A9P3LKY6_9APHY|nr:hypothetical protein PsYK624_152490 [Phanerochaete sordida]
MPDSMQLAVTNTDANTAGSIVPPTGATRHGSAYGAACMHTTFRTCIKEKWSEQHILELHPYSDNNIITPE